MAEKSFEKSLKELEEIVRKLESGDAPLDDAVKLFEQGVKLADDCSSILKNAEQKVVMLTKNSEGEMQEQKFTGEESTRG